MVKKFKEGDDNISEEEKVEEKGKTIGDRVDSFCGKLKSGFSILSKATFWIFIISVSGFIILFSYNSVTSRPATHDPLKDVKKGLSMYEKSMLEMMQAARNEDGIMKEILAVETKSNEELSTFFHTSKKKMDNFFDATEKKFKNLVALQLSNDKKLKENYKKNELKSLETISENIKIAAKNVKCGTFEFAKTCLDRLRDATVGIINTEHEKVQVRK